MWLYRSMLKIQWIAHITNKEVLKRMNRELEIMHIIKSRKLEYLGYVRNQYRYSLLQSIIQWKEKVDPAGEDSHGCGIYELGLGKHINRIVSSSYILEIYPWNNHNFLSLLNWWLFFIIPKRGSTVFKIKIVINLTKRKSCSHFKSIFLKGYGPRFLASLEIQWEEKRAEISEKKTLLLLSSRKI